MLDLGRSLVASVSRAPDALALVDGEIRQLFAEPGLRDDPPGVPVEASSAEVMLDWLRRG